MTTESELKEDIAQLKEQIAILERQKEILLNALDGISSSYTQQTTKTLTSAKDTLKSISDEALSAMKQAVLLTPKKP